MAAPGEATRGQPPHRRVRWRRRSLTAEPTTWSTDARGGRDCRNAPSKQASSGSLPARLDVVPSRHVRLDHGAPALGRKQDFRERAPSPPQRRGSRRGGCWGASRPCGVRVGAASRDRDRSRDQRRSGEERQGFGRGAQDSRARRPPGGSTGSPGNPRVLITRLGLAKAHGTLRTARPSAADQPYLRRADPPFGRAGTLRVHSYSVGP